MFGQGKKALIIDDEEALREVIVEVLSLSGIDSFMAENGAKAIELASQHKNEIGLLLIDLFMPDLSGIETYQQLCKVLPAIPVIFMSGLNNDQELFSSLNRDNYIFLKKPFSIEALIETVSNILAKAIQSP